MFFTRTTTFTIPVTREDITKRLVGKHVRIHNLDFEVMEDEGSLSIIPHAEQINSIKTLPITTVDMRPEGASTKVIVTSRMRKLDSGGPQIVVIFCAFLFAASFILLYVGGEKLITYTMLGIASAIMVLFSFRMQTGYFDYVRKVRAYVKARATGAPVERGSAVTPMVA